MIESWKYPTWANGFETKTVQYVLCISSSKMALFYEFILLTIKREINQTK